MNSLTYILFNNYLPMKITYKKYQCKECWYEKEIDTNHFWECYNLWNYNKCKNMHCVCNRPLINSTYKPTTWICMETPLI